MIRKLRRKFVCINMLIVTLMLIVILGLTVGMTGNSLKEESLDILRSSYAPDKKDPPISWNGKDEKSQKPNAVPTEPRPEGQKPIDDSTNKGEKNNKEQKNPRMPTFTLSYSPTGTLVAEGSDFYDLSDTVRLQSILDEAASRGTEQGVLWAESLRFLRNNASSYSFIDMGSEKSTVWNLFLDCLLIGSIAFGGFLLLSILLARWAIRPVEKAWNQQQQFISDASHELKTPLTVIITEAELLSDPKTGEGTKEQCVANILETSHRMRSLTEEMLTLARTESAQQELLEEICSLSDLMEDSLLSFEPLFFERSLELQGEIEAGITVKGNEGQLRQLGDILLDNAQKYSLPGTTHLTLKKQGHKFCELTLSNPAQPMTEEDLDRIFRRFHRIDQARTATGSYGLGLSIARSIVLRHKGTIKAEQHEGILTFRIRLPLSS